MEKKKVVLNWSGGKDSALALHRLLENGEYDVSLLLTTLNQEYRRVSQHGVREELLEMQAASVGIPLKKVWLPKQVSMQRYGSIMSKALAGIREKGIRAAAFGDIFLDGLRRYREEKLSGAGFQALFPIWGGRTDELAGRFIDSGFRAKVVCVNARYLDASFAGRKYDHAFLESLPGCVDPCGERGEFHTFVCDGPLFDRPVPVVTGETVYRRIETVHRARDSKPGSPVPDDGEQAGLWFVDLKPPGPGGVNE